MKTDEGGGNVRCTRKKGPGDKEKKRSKKAVKKRCKRKEGDQLVRDKIVRRTAIN